MTYLVITATIETDTDSVVPHLSFEDVMPVVTEKSLKTWKSSSENVREQGLFLLGNFGVNVTQPLHMIVVGVFVVSGGVACPHLRRNHLGDLSVHCGQSQSWGVTRRIK